MRRRSPRALIAALCLSTVAACGDSAASGPAAAGVAGDDVLQVSPQNSTLLLGVDRISLAILDGAGKPVVGARATVDIGTRGGPVFESRPLQFIGPEYGNIPVYLGTARFPRTGEIEYVVHATLADGSTHTGHAFENVVDRTGELPVGHSVSEVADIRQPVAHDVGGNLAKLDSAVKDGRADPDPWHDATIADGLARHRPMVLYFGEPGRCVSQTCGPTVQVLEQIYPAYRDRMLFEHIEIHFPADGSAFNPVYVAFGLQSEPWIYFVNAAGVVADRFEGPVTVEQLRSAAEGTLAGHVPAVDVALS